MLGICSRKSGYRVFQFTIVARSPFTADIFGGSATSGVADCATGNAGEKVAVLIEYGLRVDLHVLQERKDDKIAFAGNVVIGDEKADVQHGKLPGREVHGSSRYRTGPRKGKLLSIYIFRQGDADLNGIYLLDLPNSVRRGFLCDMGSE